MRALVTDPSALQPARYERFVRRSQLSGLLPDHLVEGEPYLALNALVLDESESALLKRLTATFSSIFDKAGRALAGNVPGLEEMGFPWVAAELLAAEPPRTPIVGRFDFLCDQAGHWWLVEFNADTPSGIREALVADRLVRELLPAGRGLRRPNDGMDQRLVARFCAALGDLPPGSALGLVTNSGELEDLAQMAFTQALLRGPLGAHGIEVVLGDAHNLSSSHRGIALCGHRIDALYRYLPYESMLGTPHFSAIADAAAAGNLGVLNGLFGLLLQHKGALAWLWSHRDDPLFSPSERLAIGVYLPPTWMIEEVPADVDRRALVVKQVFGREGEEVFFGDELDDDAWRELVRRKTYVAQQQVDVQPVEAAVPTSLGPEVRRGTATVGSFALSGTWGGYYSRFGGRIITSRAKWLATFVE